MLKKKRKGVRVNRTKCIKVRCPHCGRVSKHPFKKKEWIRDYAECPWCEYGIAKTVVELKKFQVKKIERR